MSPDHKRLRTLIQYVEESISSAPLAEPSWAEPAAGPSFGDSEDIDDTAKSLSSPSLTSEPFLFSLLAFTFSPTKQQVFHFPSPHEETNQEVSPEPDTEEFPHPDEEPSQGDPDPDEESGSDYEDAPEFLVTVSGHASCVFRCQPNDLVVIRDKIRAEILMMFQIFIPKGARCCESQYAEALRLLIARAHKTGTIQVPKSGQQSLGLIEGLTTLSFEHFDDLL